MAIKFDQGLLGSPFGDRGSGGGCTTSKASTLCSSLLKPKSPPEGCQFKTAQQSILKMASFPLCDYVIMIADPHFRLSDN